MQQYHEGPIHSLKMINTLQIYTNDSGIGDNIRLTVYYQTFEQTQDRYLGKDTNHNVYAVNWIYWNIITQNAGKHI